MSNQQPSKDYQLVRTLSPEESRYLAEILLPPPASAHIEADKILVDHLAQEANNTHSARKGSLMYLLAFLAVWAVLAVGVIWKFDPGRPLVLLGFALLTAATFGVFLWQDYAHSPGGVLKDMLRENSKAGKRQDELRGIIAQTLKDK